MVFLFFLGFSCGLTKPGVGFGWKNVDVSTIVRHDDTIIRKSQARLQVNQLLTLNSVACVDSEHVQSSNICTCT